mmetsp:Transcript_69/g.234  ORF Transcript_69/g.234 Transcript_69/m.234 type:complete len:633 (-) Transcript_69:79-1977(-)
MSGSEDQQSVEEYEDVTADRAYELFMTAQGHEDDGELSEAFAAYELIQDVALEELGKRKDVGMDYNDLASLEEPPLHVIASTAANCAGGLFLDNRDFEDAREWFQRALEWWDGAVMARLNLANIEREHGNPTTAITLYKKLVAQEEDLRKIKAEIGNAPKKPQADSGAADAKDENDEENDKAKNEDNSNEMEEEDQEEEEEEEGEGNGWIEHWVDAPVESCAEQAAYLLALMHHQWGDFDEAIPYLQKYPVKWRIGPEVWKCVGQNPELGGPKTAKEDAPVRLLKNALDADLMKALCSSFSPSSPFWEGTNYADGAYFSFWYDITQKPSNLVEKAIQELLPLVGRDDIVGAEWWVHSRPSGRNLGHQLHFDTEENSLNGKDATILHPVVSSVTYLTGDNAGAGPTVVFDQRVDDVEPATRAYVANPVNGSFLMFPGDRLHGVLPGRPPQSAKRTRNAETKLRDPTQVTHRLTLLVGFWNQDVAKIGKRRRLGPCAPFPRASRGVDWPSVIDLPAGDASPSKKGKSSSESTETTSSGPIPLGVHQVPDGLAWEGIPAGAEPPRFSLPEGLDQHFFVEDHAEFRERLLQSALAARESAEEANEDVDEDVADADADVDASASGDDEDKDDADAEQ